MIAMKTFYETRWERAERLNGRLAMVGIVAAVAAFLVTGSIW